MRLPPGRYVENGREYVFDECPSCGRGNSFYWNPVKEVGHCWAQKHCGIRVGSRDKLIKLLMHHGIGYLPVLDEPVVKENTATWGVQGTLPITESIRGSLFLFNKGLKLGWAERCGLRMSANDAYVLAPLYCVDEKEPTAHMERSVDANIKGWRFRHHHPDPKYKGQKGYYIFCSPDVLSRTHQQPTGIIVEGVGDLIKHPLLVYYGVAVLGVKINPVIGWWLSQKFEKIVVWADNDEAGTSLWKATKRMMRGFGVPTWRYQDTSVKDPGDAEPIESFEQLDLPPAWG